MGLNILGAVVMKKKTKSSLKTTIFVFFSLLIVVIVALGFVGNFFYDIALNPKADNSIIISEALDLTENKKTNRVKAINWMTDKEQDVYITSDDNLRLHGYRLDNPETNKWAIILHGYGGNALKMSIEAEHIYNMGYNVIMPDMRGCGESEGNAIGMGWLDRMDVLKWIDYIIANDEKAEILLYGVSMGGAAVMMTTGEVLPQNVKCAVEDCGYSSVKEEFDIQIDEFFGLPSFPVITSADVVCFFRAGYTFEQASSVEQVKRSKTPTLFIHGSADEFVPFSMLDKVYNAAECPKEKLVIEGAGHVGSSGTDPELYWSTVENFINKYI